MLKIKEALESHKEGTGKKMLTKDLALLIPGETSKANKVFLMSSWGHGKEMHHVTAEVIIIISDATGFAVSSLLGIKYANYPCCDVKAAFIFKLFMQEETKTRDIVASAVKICNDHKVGPKFLFDDHAISGDCGCEKKGT